MTSCMQPCPLYLHLRHNGLAEGGGRYASPHNKSVLRFWASLMQPNDRMYNCLPMYHSVGGVVAVLAILLAGGSVVIRERFSSARFWSDIVAFDCTLFQYIGELCRYLGKCAAGGARKQASPAALRRQRTSPGAYGRPSRSVRNSTHSSVPRRRRAPSRSTMLRGSRALSAGCQAFIAHRFNVAIVNLSLSVKSRCGTTPGAASVVNRMNPARPWRIGQAHDELEFRGL